MTSFTRKKIDVTLKLQNNETFDDAVNTTLKLSNYRVEADIRNIGMMGAGSKARIKIYGMSLNDMNKFTVMNYDSMSKSKNIVIVSAGDSNGMAQVFDGDIMQAWADFSGMPESCLTIDATFGHIQQVMPANGTATQTDTPIADMMQDLATKMGYGFENHGVTGTLSAMTLKGSYIDQARTVANAAGIFWTIENNTLTIAPQGQAIHKGQIPLLNERTGLMGYPAISSKGISLTCLFNPAIKFRDFIKVETPITAAEGEWVVSSLNYRLESEKVGGAWFCQIEAMKEFNFAGEANNGPT